MNDAEVLIKFKGDTTDAENAQDRLKQEFNKTKKAGELAFAGVTAAVDAMVGSIVKSGIEYNASIETYLTRLETLTGSAEEANNILEQIKQDALSTPFEVSSLTQAESLLLSTGLSAKDARKDILALGNAISASGGGNEELARMAVNLQQIKNVGKASALDIKQFAFAGIDIYGLLADSMGVTREEASELDVTYDMLSNALQKASAEGGKYYGAMENQSKTYKGAMSNLSESVNVFAGAMSEGLFNAIKDLIPKLTDMFNWLIENKDIITAIAVPLLTFINTMAGMIIISKVTTLIKGLWLAMTANPIGLIVAAIAGLVAGFVYLWNNCEAFRNFFIGMWEGIANAALLAVNFLANAIKKIAGLFTNLWNNIVSIFRPDALLNIGKQLIEGLWNGIKSAKDWVINKIKGIGKSIIGAVKGIFGIHSPSKEFAIIGEYNMLGLEKGMEDMQPEIQKDIDGMFDLSPSMTGSMNNVLSPIVNVYSNVSVEQDPLGQMVNKIKSFSGGAKNDYNWGAGI